MIRAAEIRSVAGRLGDHGGGVMTADIIKGAEHAVGTTRNDKRFAIEIGGEKFAGLSDLIGAADHLPGAMEDGALFQFGEARIGVPGRWNRIRLRERRAGVVSVNDICERFHFYEADYGLNSPAWEAFGNLMEATARFVYLYDERGFNARVPRKQAIRRPVESDCVFCAIQKEAQNPFRVWEDESTFVFLDHRPLFPGHCLLITKRHVATLADLDAGLLHMVFDDVCVVSMAVQNAMNAEGTFVGVMFLTNQTPLSTLQFFTPNR